jgi:squalene-associated FAD-dependent desaturase
VLLVRVVVVGGGFAGFAAAIALQERRHEVTLVERRGILGGRATSFRDKTFDEDVDNGTHLMVGAYRETFDLLRRSGAESFLLPQTDLSIDYMDSRGSSSLRCPPLPAPLHLLFGLLFLRLPWRVRFEACRLAVAVRFGPPPAGLTLAEFFARTGQGREARRLLWDPLATAIVNESPERAAAVLFYRVFKEAFLTTRRASSLVFLKAGWGAVMERVASYFVNRGGRLLRRALAETLLVGESGARGLRLMKRPEDRESIARGVSGSQATLEADAVILAVPWNAVAPLIPEPHRGPFETYSSLGASPIVSVDMWVDRTVLDRPMVGLRGEEMEWVFDKGRLFGRCGPPQHLSFVLSAAHRANPRVNADLVASAEGALRRLFPKMAGANVLKSLVLREAQATFVPSPDHEGLRPPARTSLPGLFLAGDWTHTGLPATIEGAVRSGNEAARAVELFRTTRGAGSPGEGPR